MIVDDVDIYSPGFGPVFIVGMSGSGTTMIADCLGNHPDLYVFPRETRVFPYFISKIPSFGDLTELSARRKLSNTLGKTFEFLRANHNEPLVLNDYELTEPGFGGVVNSLMRRLTAEQGKIRWGEKSPMYLQHISLLDEYFPNAQFLHIYRDGRDVAQSVHRRWRLDPRRTIYRWRNIVTRGIEQGKKLNANRFMEVSYEKLTQNPEAELTKICHFLNLKFHPDILKSSMRQMDPEIRTGSIVKNISKWKGYFSEKRISEMESIAGNLLIELGYEIYTLAGSQQPQKIQILIWLLHDRFQAVRYVVRKYGMTSITDNFRRILTLMRQRRTNIN
jgi:hypothetical protein